MAQNWDNAKEEWRATNFINGQDLLKKRYLDDDEGWKLPTDRVVPRDFSRIQRLSRASSPLRNWDDWHTWRSVPNSSPAYLLIHYPMSIYWMLTETLNVASLGSKEPRAHLTVHYIGAELELNFIPILSELALLLPHHDVDIVFFGPCGKLSAQNPVLIVFTLVQRCPIIVDTTIEIDHVDALHSYCMILSCVFVVYVAFQITETKFEFSATKPNFPNVGI
ncbi:hypothetical protein B0H19DRAFT_1245516 [Mycena capillaripes]|nr:hypothetical protein B0H19DRAFT_1245516 [Mycena capillaripes]